MAKDPLAEGDLKLLATRKLRFHLLAAKTRRAKDAEDFEELDAPGYKAQTLAGDVDGDDIVYEMSFELSKDIDEPVPVMGHFVTDPTTGAVMRVKEYEKAKWFRTKGDRIVVRFRR